MHRGNPTIVKTASVLVALCLVSQFFATTVSAEDGYVDHFADRFNEIVTKKKDAVDALVTIFTDRQLLPENGVFHTMACGRDFYEWMIPLLTRPDLIVIASEPGNTKWGDVIGQVTDFKRFKKEVWGHLVKHNPELLTRSAYDGLTAERLFEIVNKRVWVQPTRDAITFEPGAGGSHHPFTESTPVPKAHFILSRLQIGDNIERAVESHLRENGVSWHIDEYVSPEQFSDGFETKDLKGFDATHYAAPFETEQEGHRFLGQLHFRVFTFMMAHKKSGKPPADPENSEVYRKHLSDIPNQFGEPPGVQSPIQALVEACQRWLAGSK